MPKGSHRRRSGRQYRIWGPWKYEIASVLLSVGLNIAIAVLLAQFDTQTVPDWGQYLNLNALLALLSTFLRATLVIIISQVVSQRKWMWFSDQKRPLADLEIFDAGSRGTLGAMSLIFKVLWRDPVTVIAGSTVAVSFLVGPFVQQASRTQDCLFPALELNASIPYAHNVPRRKGFFECDFSSGECYGGALDTFVSPDLYAAIISAVSLPYGMENQIHADCATGNCTFTHNNVSFISTQMRQQDLNEDSTHSTVGVCNKCTDVTSLLQMRNITDFTVEHVEYSLPTSPWRLNVTPQYEVDRFRSWGAPVTINSSRTLDWMGDLLNTEAKAAARSAYVNVTVLATDIQDRPATALVCSLYPCVRTYATSVTKSTFSEKLVEMEVMQLDVTPSLTRSSDSSLDLWNWAQEASTLDRMPGTPDFVVVKSPCQYQGHTFSISDEQ
ncbi:hypothetical protein C7974DRAFT_468834 [Boeremia exigua]|uniref:uncharacterized protein n=1 Tax=Boeremia exigua TaxID=749465 RepID=UPI001E8E45EE|nr:uncharacterized protein C7974DRAFT_468834 [Boeremia exigua]KAH6642484.1 hypothetical protein C7974DRAFT_468834 [Boeremia exigua]